MTAGLAGAGSGSGSGVALGSCCEGSAVLTSVRFCVSGLKAPAPWPGLARWVGADGRWLEAGLSFSRTLWGYINTSSFVTV